jgi:hypothetical protein
MNLCPGCPDSTNPFTVIIPTILSVAVLFITGADDVLQYLYNAFTNYLPTILKISGSLIVGIISRYYIARKAQKDWEDQEFLKAVQISLNFCDDLGGEKKILRFRTLDECRVDELMNHNQEGIAQIVSACESCTVEQSFLVVNDKVQFKQFDAFMKAVINRISVKFAEGYLDYDFRVPVLRKEYWVGLTCEKPSTAKEFARKIRVMVCSDGFLRSIEGMEEPEFEIKHHAARWACMKEMYDLYTKDKQIEEEKVGNFWEKKALRKLTIFRAQHYPFEHDEKGAKIDMVRKGKVIIKPSESPVSGMSNKTTTPTKFTSEGKSTPSSMVQSYPISRVKSGSISGGGNSTTRLLKAPSIVGDTQ